MQQQQHQQQNHQRHHHRPQHHHHHNEGFDTHDNPQYVSVKNAAADAVETGAVGIGAVIVIIVSLLVFGHSYIRDLLTWLEQVDIKVSVSVIMGLFCVISFPMAWGLSLLMVTCG